MSAMAITQPHDYITFNARLLTALAEVQTVHVFERGATLFREGDTPAGVHVLLSGEIELMFTLHGELAPINFAVPGQILGLSSIVSGRLNEYTATAATTVLTGFVDRETLFRVLHDAPERWFDVLQVLSSDISSCYSRVKELASTGTVKRAAH